MIGKTISHYKITEKLGEGGMGVVYKVEDTTLERTVALKFLAAHLLKDEEARKRFRREAKAAAGLSHPNICTVYEISEEAGRTFLAMEFIEGESLDVRIERGPLSLKDALGFARQVADGLTLAHTRGVVHRDIKPGNLLVTPEGRVKILDFGLALLTEGSKLTKLDTTVGTVAYMSPEQAQGMEVDYRTDIWALGCVLYEMVCGQRPFRGVYDQALVYEIVHQEPEPLTGLRTAVPIELELLIGKCLAKDPGHRYQHADELAVDLETLGEKLKSGKSTILRTAVAGSTALSTGPAGVGASRPLPFRALLQSKFTAALTLISAISVALAFWSLTKSASETPISPVRFTIRLPTEQQLVDQAPLALSPDGTLLVYVAQAGGGPAQLFLRRVDQFEAVPIAGTEGASFPFFSPDGKWVGYSTDGELKKVPLAGGPPSTICEVLQAVDGTWGHDGRIVFSSPLLGPGLWIVSASGGKPEALTTIRPGIEALHRNPVILLGRDAVLFTVQGGSLTAPQTHIVSLKTGEQRVLIEEGRSVQYVKPGYLIYAQGGSLLAAPFDIDELRLTGPALSILEGMVIADGSRPSVAVSANGTLVYHESAPNPSSRSLYRVSRQGVAEELTGLRRRFGEVRISPDGQRLAVRIQSPASCDIWVYEFAQDTLTRLTFEGDNHGPTWSPDSKRVTFDSRRMGVLNLFSKPIDGGNAQLVLQSENPLHAPAWSPDGSALVYEETNPATGKDIRVYLPEDDNRRRPFAATRFNERSPAVSPDGKWLAYVSDESGEPEVYVQRYPGGGQKRKISTSGGMFPQWARDGSELFYRDGDRVMAVRIENAPAFTRGRPQELFRGPYGAYDVSLDGQSFLMVKLEETPEKGQIYVVLNWIEEVKRRLGGSGDRVSPD